MLKMFMETGSFACLFVFYIFQSLKGKHEPGLVHALVPGGRENSFVYIQLLTIDLLFRT